MSVFELATNLPRLKRIGLVRVSLTLSFATRNSIDDFIPGGKSHGSSHLRPLRSTIVGEDSLVVLREHHHSSDSRFTATSPEIDASQFDWSASIQEDRSSDLVSNTTESEHSSFSLTNRADRTGKLGFQLSSTTIVLRLLWKGSTRATTISSINLCPAESRWKWNHRRR